MEQNKDHARTPQQIGEATIWASETLRSGAAAGTNAPPKDEKEERVSVFWRIFGGTVLSIVALAVVTVYNQMNAAINELRGEVNRINEIRGDLVKKDEFTTRATTIWNSIRELQANNATLSALKEKSMVRDQQWKDAEERRETMHKDLHAIGAAVTALKERAVLQDQQIKEREERMELVRELQKLRERLATLEGRQTTVQPAVHKEQ